MLDKLHGPVGRLSRSGAPATPHPLPPCSLVVAPRRPVRGKAARHGSVIPPRKCGAKRAVVVRSRVGGVGQLVQRLPRGLERGAAGVLTRRKPWSFMPDEVRDDLLGDRLVLQ